ncbi:hypothetical protein Tco_0404686 [Tanacetum coccineum]
MVFQSSKTSAVHEKTMTLRSCLRWKPTGKIFKTVGLRLTPNLSAVHSFQSPKKEEPQCLVAGKKTVSENPRASWNFH